MAPALPKTFALKSQDNDQYLAYIPDNVVVQGFLKFYAEDLSTDLTKFEAEEAKCGDGLVHIKCCPNNKYWRRWSPNLYWIAAEGDVPEENQSKWSCTLFKPVFVDGDATTLQLRHVQLNRNVFSSADDYEPYTCCLSTAPAKTGDGKKLDIFTMTDLAPVPSGYKKPDELPLGRHEDAVLPRRLEDIKITRRPKDAKPRGRSQDAELPRRPEDSKPRGRSQDARPSGRLEDAKPRSRSEDARPPGRLEDTKPRGRPEDAELPRRPEDSKPRGRSQDVKPPVRLVDAKPPVMLEGANSRSWTRGDAKTDDETDYQHSSSKETKPTPEKTEILGIEFKLDKAKITKETVVMGTAIIRNDKAEHVRERDVKFAYKKTESSKWETKSSGAAGKTKNVLDDLTYINSAIPLIVNEKDDLSWDSFAGAYSWGEPLESKHIKVYTSYKAIMPAKTHVTITLKARKASIVVPFSYTKRATLQDGTRLLEMKDDGIYTGVNHFNFNITQEEKSKK